MKWYRSTSFNRMEIIRIVRLSWKAEKINEFISIYESSKSSIESFDGNKYLTLKQDANLSNVLYTYSIWESNEALNNYRNSQFFKETWAKTKLLFDDKPLAYSLMNVENNWTDFNFISQICVTLRSI